MPYITTAEGHPNSGGFGETSLFQVTNYILLNKVQYVVLCVGWGWKTSTGLKNIQEPVIFMFTPQQDIQNVNTKNPCFRP